MISFTSDLCLCIMKVFKHSMVPASFPYQQTLQHKGKLTNPDITVSGNISNSDVTISENRTMSVKISGKITNPDVNQ